MAVSLVRVVKAISPVSRKRVTEVVYNATREAELDIEIVRVAQRRVPKPLNRGLKLLWFAATLCERELHLEHMFAAQSKAESVEQFDARWSLYDTEHHLASLNRFGGHTTSPFQYAARPSIGRYRKFPYSHLSIRKGIKVILK